MKYSMEKIYHFTCMSCDLWWSIAAENISIEKNTWTCPWCGYEHKPPHTNLHENCGTPECCNECEPDPGTDPFDIDDFDLSSK